VEARNWAVFIEILVKQEIGTQSKKRKMNENLSIFPFSLFHRENVFVVVDVGSPTKQESHSE
jgi:hypothetical protein